MRIKIILKTSLGEFEGKTVTANADDLEKAKELLQSAAKGALSYMNFETSTGDAVFLSEDMIVKSIFILKVLV